MTEGENAEGECTVSLRRVLKYVVRQTGKTGQVEGIEKNKICCLPQWSWKKIKGENTPEPR